MTKRLLVTLAVLFNSLTIGAPGPKPDTLKIDIYTSTGDGGEQSHLQHNTALAALVDQSNDG